MHPACATLARDEISLAELTHSLRDQFRVSFSLMLRRDDNGWTLHAAMVDVRAVPYDSLAYDYGHVAFVRGVIAGDRVASWLSKLSGKAGGFRFVVPQPQENISSDRYPSHSSRDLFLRLPLPYSYHRISISSPAERLQGYYPLVKAGCPSFPNLFVAANKLVYDRPYDRERQPDAIIVRVAHTEAWIEQVRLQPSAVSVSVEGKGVRGTRLEVRGEPDVAFDLKLRKAGVRRFPVPQGLPRRLWVILTRGDRWLDYRDIDLSGNVPTGGGSVVADPPDVCAQIEGLIARGESDTREFKREISNDKKTTFLKTVAAFANGEGGVILFGVADQTGEIEGIKGDVAREKDRVIGMIRDNVVPQPDLRVESCAVAGKQVVALFIEKGDGKPYGLNPAKPAYYVRRGATTFPATQAEARILARGYDRLIGNGFFEL